MRVPKSAYRYRSPLLTRLRTHAPTQADEVFLACVGSKEGALGLSELQLVLERLGAAPVSSEQGGLLLEQLDTNKDGVVTIDDFSAAMSEFAASLGGFDALSTKLLPPPQASSDDPGAGAGLDSAGPLRYSEDESLGGGRRGREARLSSTNSANSSVDMGDVETGSREYIVVRRARAGRKGSRESAAGQECVPYAVRPLPSLHPPPSPTPTHATCTRARGVLGTWHVAARAAE